MAPFSAELSGYLAYASLSRLKMESTGHGGYEFSPPTDTALPYSRYARVSDPRASKDLR
jgi:hypothetical protein